MPKQNPDAPQSVFGKVAAILDQFTIEQPKLTLTEITEGTGISKTTVFRLLSELVDLGYVNQTDKTYRLGMSLFRLGLVAREQMGLDYILNGLLQPLAETTQETVITATISGNQILYVHVIESVNQLRFVVGAGARRDIPFGATGMALLSQLDTVKQRELLSPPFKRFTEKTITDLPTYLNRLEQVKANNLVVERGEYYDGIMALAIPIPGRTPLTITVVGPEERMLPIQDLVIDELIKASTELKLLRYDLPTLV